MQVCYLVRISSFNDLHDIAQRFNVRCAVIDLEPELRAAREFQRDEQFPVFLCDYQDSLTTGTRWDEQTKLVKVNRTRSATRFIIWLPPPASWYFPSAMRRSRYSPRRCATS